jgi:UDP-N-acetylglucosamine--N-acetylmuramyl-(pentapeptide) pyrophosphoryl-undecaprenol N-acetylglucosamine transferase
MAAPSAPESADACFAIVTGGGTSGHTLPAIAIMDRLVLAGHPSASMHYVGTCHGIEARLLPPTGYRSTLLDVVGLQRRLSWRNVMFLPKLMRATWHARGLMRARRPAVVVNVGGYASMPATFAARLCRIPVVVVSYDRRPGLASRVGARGAAAVASAFADSSLPNATVTGAPLRPDIISVNRLADRSEARQALDMPVDRFVISVFGGSLGAKALNDAVSGLVERWSERADVLVHHVVGDRWLSGASPARGGPAGIMYRVIGYDDRMPQLYAASDLMICRAGASTIAELAATGTPAVIVPWPGAAENHQLDNARTLSDIGAAVLLQQVDLTVDRLAETVDGFIHHSDRLAAIAEAAFGEGERHRGDSLIALIDRVANA